VEVRKPFSTAQNNRARRESRLVSLKFSAGKQDFALNCGAKARSSLRSSAGALTIIRNG